MEDLLKLILDTDGFWAILTTTAGSLVAFADRYFGVSRHLKAYETADIITDFIKSDSMLDRWLPWRKGQKQAFQESMTRNVKAIEALRLLKLLEAESPLGKAKAGHLKEQRDALKRRQLYLAAFSVLLGLGILEHWPNYWNDWDEEIGFIALVIAVVFYFWSQAATLKNTENDEASADQNGAKEQPVRPGNLDEILRSRLSKTEGLEQQACDNIRESIFKKLESEIFAPD